MLVEDFEHYCSELLKLEDYASIDPSRNGLQVERQNRNLGKVAFAVDGALQTFRQAGELGADLLFVHHGIFWGHEYPLTGTDYQRIRLLVEQDIALYAAHLPLDAHEELGNNICMARALKLTDIEPFGWFKGKTIGFRGSLNEELEINEVLAELGIPAADCNAILPFGPARNRQVGIISGGASRETNQAIDADLDLYISGEANHTIYHPAQENGINVIAAGHYNTETWGVRAMAARVAADTDIETVFIDIPTGL